MDGSFVVLAGLQLINLMVFWWVNRVFVSQPRWNHPAIFHNAAARTVLLYGPILGMVALAIAAFVYTDSPWLFLGATLIGWVSASARPHSDLMQRSTRG